MERWCCIHVHPSFWNPGRWDSVKVCRQDIIDDPTDGTTQDCCMEECSQAVFSSLQRGALLKNSTLHSSSYSRRLYNTTIIKHHYHTFYNKIEPAQWHCSTCGTTLRRHSNPKLCPHPQTIEEHLQEYMGFIKENDKLVWRTEDNQQCIQSVGSRAASQMAKWHRETIWFHTQ